MHVSCLVDWLDKDEYHFKKCASNTYQKERGEISKCFTCCLSETFKTMEFSHIDAPMRMCSMLKGIIYLIVFLENAILLTLNIIRYGHSFLPVCHFFNILRFPLFISEWCQCFILYVFLFFFCNIYICCFMLLWSVCVDLDLVWGEQADGHEFLTLLLSNMKWVSE